MHGKIQQNQARIATGKNILKASDDPIAAVNISAAKEQKTENARYIENIGRALFRNMGGVMVIEATKFNYAIPKKQLKAYRYIFPKVSLQQ